MFIACKKCSRLADCINVFLLEWVSLLRKELSCFGWLIGFPLCVSLCMPQVKVIAEDKAEWEDKVFVSEPFSRLPPLATTYCTVEDRGKDTQLLNAASTWLRLYGMAQFWITNMIFWFAWWFVFFFFLQPFLSPCFRQPLCHSWSISVKL